MTPTTSVEVETKFAVQDSTVVPDLTRISGVASVASTEKFSLHAVYFDTADLRLTRAKITLRRRTGGKDEGWHIKLPDAGEGRQEIAVELNEDDYTSPDQPFTVPEELLGEVQAIIRTEPLKPIATIDNTRRESVLTSDDGTPLAFFCDDRVTAKALIEGGRKKSWREWELELAPGLAGTHRGDRVLDTSEEILLAAGATTSALPSKLLVALGTAVDTAPEPALPLEWRPVERSDEAFAILLQQLRDRRDAIISADAQARAGELDALKLIVENSKDLRFLFSMLLDLFAHDAWDDRLDIIPSLRAQLKALNNACQKAVAADLEHTLMHEIVLGNPTGLIDSFAANRLKDGALIRRDRETRRAHVALTSTQYLDLLDDIDAFLADPPVPSRSERRKAVAIAVRAVKRSWRDLSSLIESVTEDMDNTGLTPNELQHAVNQLRKASQRLYMSANIADAVTPYKARRLTKQTRKLLHEVEQAQAYVDSCNTVLQRARQANRHREDTFSYGMVYETCRHAAIYLLTGAEERAQEVAAAYKRFTKSVRKS